MTISLSRSAPPSPVCFTKPVKIDLCLYRGDSGRLRVEVNDDAGDPIDITTATWDCDIRAAHDDAAPLVTLAVEPVVGETNMVDLVLDAGDSETLDADGVWDLEMTLNGQVITLLYGDVFVTKDVSRA